MAIHASILAAGVGRRMGTAGVPKILIEFDGVSLLQRHLDGLERAGVNDVSMVCGYKFWQVISALEAAARSSKVDAVINAGFRSGSVISVSKLRRYWIGFDRYILMDADVLCPPDFLRLLCATDTAADICLLGDFNAECDAEAVKIVESSNGTVADFGKQVTATGARVGESVGFFSFSPQAASFVVNRARDDAAAAADAGADGTPYEDVIRDAIQSGLFSTNVCDISGAPWTELDFPSDIEFAEAHVMPRLRSIERGEVLPEVVSESVR